ncbi:phosphonate C-P lyase system protein PhnH [Jeotgalicoccus coquinae]|uniref:Alpha-D-ribose 1-methylphosphonate 5-triphosphate synthase subunit PhnH n=1 Tax=Jeotgalicoccus coquinae TaxID=709509 RepID=A0A6V7RTK6_9STAP|nr:phosphonate C-P lyase system protein PhnH [Jeotgalicoccus coquinae]MBB6424250.1 alpha-D-ribose 1-methylphosphonate 5-triphosphate synthase subunit PhnH [Jeotgalicoccus coquinae]GGE25283.1 phosphonate C-P lyase system protein PhnH [Jeotgalicoccus coquinae]CAD2081595.1 Alpha-D-ribose 1-methylphosphonate 5-triphosphate synthase subunit PhnH [Jeotgalicoccus coquinae]
MKTIVHTTQQVYRQLINASSRPGHTENISEEVKNYSDFSDAALLAAMTLFDNEISFFSKDKTMRKELKVLTGGIPNKDHTTADFIISKAADLKKKYFREVMKGILISPEKSATLIIDLNSIGEGTEYSLTGPGIKDETNIKLSLDSSWMELRNEVCKEFPLGIDLVLTDKQNNLVIIPRTTKAEVK